MGVTSEIEMRFPKEKHAHWAMHVAEELIKLACAPSELPWVKEAEACPSLSAQYLAFRRQAADLDLDKRGTALESLRRFRTKLFIDRCQDVARWDNPDDPWALFPQLCFAYALRFPQVPFSAFFRHEIMMSGAILLLRVQYDGKVMHIQKKTGMRPMIEDDWSRDLVCDYIAEDGAFVRKGIFDPMEKVKKRRAEIIARNLDEIQTICRPLLVCLSGSIAYGLDTPESDVDVRGIFLNERDELIGLREERESLRLKDADTVLYGLRKAMKLLLACNPNVVELLGPQEQDVLYCSEEGRMILEAAPSFLSKKAIFTFGAYAVNLRRQIQKQLDAEKPDKKAIAKEMMHLIRIYDMGGDLLENGRVTAYREAAHSLLVRIRAGEYQDRHGMPAPAFDRLLENYMGAFNDAAVRTRLPAEPDVERINAPDDGDRAESAAMRSNSRWTGRIFPFLSAAPSTICTRSGITS